MNIMVIINQMVQLFLVIGLGFFLRRRGSIDDAFYDRLSKFVLNVTMPFMIIGSVLKSGTGISLDTVSVVCSCVILIALLPAAAWILTMLLPVKKENRGLYIFMIMYPNVGFMGFPLMKSIFGDSSVLGTAVINMCFNVSLFTLGRMVMSGERMGKGSFRISALLSPGIIASLLAVLCYLVKLPCPSVVTDSLNLVGSMTTPLAMLLIGVILAKLPVKDILGDVRVWMFSVLIQLLIPAALYPVMKLTISDELIRGITLIIAAMPVANSAVLFASEYRKDDLFAAKTIFVSTVISIVTIPLLVTWFLL